MIFVVLLFACLISQYICIFIGILLDVFKSKEKIRKHCIPFYWVYDFAREFKQTLAKLPEKEE